MPTNHKRMTFAITPDMEPIMDRAKRMFYDRTQSDMIRTLVLARLNSLDVDNEESEQQKEVPKAVT